MDVDRETAAALGFLKPDYVKVEYERRWLCREMPPHEITMVLAITDLYVTGARLRLREARPLDGSASQLRLTRKADVNARTRLITSIYMPEEEFAVLAGALSGIYIKKLRHRLKTEPGMFMTYDIFQGALEGLTMAEVEFGTPEQMAAFPTPGFAVREVTDDPRFSGISLALHGLPQ